VNCRERSKACDCFRGTNARFVSTARRNLGAGRNRAKPDLLHQSIGAAYNTTPVAVSDYSSLRWVAKMRFARCLLVCVLMLAVISGCGPSYSEAVITYEAEQKELDRLKAKCDKLKEVMGRDVESSGDPAITKLREETDAKAEAKLKEWAAEIELQKSRVEAARKARDAAK